MTQRIGFAPGRRLHETQHCTVFERHDEWARRDARRVQVDRRTGRFAIAVCALNVALIILPAVRGWLP